MLLDPVIPIPWIVSIGIVMLAANGYGYLRSGRRLGPARNVFLLVMRCTGLLGILLLLLQPSREEEVVVPVAEKSVIIGVDVSASMAAPHSTGATRLDAARADLAAAGISRSAGGRHQFFTIGEGAAPILPEALETAAADGKSTRMDRSIGGLLRMPGTAQASAMILLTDGHDFDLVAPGETARRARARDLPIFAVPYGTMESARDVSIRIANYHPHTFVRQSTRLEVFIRTLGCANEILQVDLLLDGKPVQHKTLETGREPFHQLDFSVTHEEPGQYEYSFRVAPLPNERELSNNIATTYLNVIAERLRVLEIEGAPFWDTTFLRRSFARNDKFDIDSLVAFTGNRVRPIRSNPDRAVGDLVPPKSVEDLKAYQMVVLGRDVERVIGLDGIRALESWVKDYGGVVIFSRGQAWPQGENVAAELEPINWNTGSARGVRLEVTPQAGSVPAFRLLREVAEADEFPEVIAFPATSEPKALAATFSVAGDQSPAVVYRRYGRGQTLSLGVGNLWRWVFNPKAEYDNNAYDRFWDQLALWLLANNGVAPLEGYSLRTDTANLPLGETVRLRFGVHGNALPVSAPALVILQGDEQVTNLAMEPGAEPEQFVAEFTPREAGRYRAQVATAGGKHVTAQFMVFREKLETTETAMDVTYLEQLCKASGGRVLDVSELESLVESLLRDTADQPPLMRRIPLWDRGWIYLLLSVILSCDWYFRRRWGLS